MALLGLLAYKAVKGSPVSGSGEGLGDMLRNAFAGNAGANPGGGLGGVLSGGLGDLIKQFQSAGRSYAATSWVGTGQNIPLPTQDLSKVLRPEQIDFLTERTGLSREELLTGLTEQLPKVVDHLTPDGRLPTPEEINRVL
jgi:uncharacterized protein YidB (DUF937 family)